MRFFFLLFPLIFAGHLGAILEDVLDDVGSCVVVNVANGKCLLQKEACRPMFPASCTKIATLAYVLSQPGCLLQRTITVPKEAVRVLPDAEKARDNFSRYPSYVQEATGTSARLIQGEAITIQTALYGMMLVSGNDAANSLAYHFGDGSIEQFMQNMNEFISKIGCRSTFFKNPHGLHHPDHLSSAYDLALLALYGMRTQPMFRQIVSSLSYTKPRTNKQEAVTWQQANKLLRKGRFYCEQATGIKTGRHMRAMENIVVSGKNDRREVVVVLMRCADRARMFQHAKKMLLYFLNEAPIKKLIVSGGPIQLSRPMPYGAPVRLRADGSFTIETYPSEMPDIRVEAEWAPLSYSVRKDEKMGELSVFVDNVVQKKIALFSLEERRASASSLVYSLKQWRSGFGVYLAAASFGLLALLLWRCSRRKRR